MRCETTSDPNAFWELAGEFLLSDPVRHNMITTNVWSRRGGARAEEEPLFVAILDGDEVVGAAMRTKPFPLTTTPMSEQAVATLVEEVWPVAGDSSGVAGPLETVRPLAERWAEKAGKELVVTSRQRLHKLDEVAPVPQPSGTWRRATQDDREVLIAWNLAFHDDVGMRPPLDPAHGIDAKIEAGHAFFWEDDGERVSHVGSHLAVAGVSRVGPVYTPAERRGRGYATALTAVVSQLLLDSGSTACSLYTDLANPTSNKIYAAIGYIPVLDVEVYTYA